MVDSADSRKRIVSVAEKVFFASGFNRVLMDDLARELGMSKKTLYAFFSSKKELLRAVMEHRTQSVEREIDGIMAREMSFPEKLRALTTFIHQKTATISPVFLEDIRRYAPGSFVIVEEFRARVIQRQFGRLVEEGVREGYVRDGIPTELLVRMLLLSIQGIVRPEILGEMRLHPGEAIEHVLGIVLKGILTEKEVIAKAVAR